MRGFRNSGIDIRVFQQVRVRKSGIDITLGADIHRSREGDCLAMQLDRPVMFPNPTRNLRAMRRWPCPRPLLETMSRLLGL